jgi:hypothetical protein
MLWRWTAVSPLRLFIVGGNVLSVSIHEVSEGVIHSNLPPTLSNSGPTPPLKNLRF